MVNAHVITRYVSSMLWYISVAVFRVYMSTNYMGMSTKYIHVHRICKDSHKQMRRMPNLYLIWMKENKETSKSDSIQRNEAESVN